jgi:glycosyltransferase involved in cell wall biosynthesis
LDIYGGGERVCHHIIKSLIEHGEHVELLTFDFDPERYAQIVGEKLPAEIVVHSLGKRIDVKPPFTVYKRRSRIIGLTKKIKGLDYDCAFSTQTMTAFESALFDEKKKNLAYVHFPEIHHSYANSGMRRKAYLWLYKRWLDKDISKLDMVFCNSEYTKGMVEKYWGRDGIPEPIVAYPPVDTEPFWSATPLKDRLKRVIYVGRFIPQKRHELMKQLAVDLPQFNFLSVGGLRETEQEWFDSFSKDLPANYAVKPNVPSPELVKLYRESRVYCHLMEGEHFGISPIEGLASGCVTLVHKSGGTGEFIPEEFRWQTYDELKEKIARWADPSDADAAAWEKQRSELWEKISILQPKVFREKIWAHVQWLMQQTENNI